MSSPHSRSPSESTSSPGDPTHSPEKKTEDPAPESPRRRPRGTAAMDEKTRQEVARKGGLAVSRNRSHMSAIGRKGGQKVSQDREHMAQIGRKGGEASRTHRPSEGAGEAPIPLPGLTRVPPIAPATPSTEEEVALESREPQKKTGT